MIRIQTCFYIILLVAAVVWLYDELDESLLYFSKTSEKSSTSNRVSSVILILQCYYLDRNGGSSGIINASVRRSELVTKSVHSGIFNILWVKFTELDDEQSGGHSNR